MVVRSCSTAQALSEKPVSLSICSNCAACVKASSQIVRLIPPNRVTSLPDTLDNVPGFFFVHEGGFALWTISTPLTVNCVVDAIY